MVSTWYQHGINMVLDLSTFSHVVSTWYQLGINMVLTVESWSQLGLKLVLNWYFSGLNIETQPAFLWVFCTLHFLNSGGDPMCGPSTGMVQIHPWVDVCPQPWYARRSHKRKAPARTSMPLNMLGLSYKLHMQQEQVRNASSPT